MGKIIGLGYKARSGKDTAADMLVEVHGFTRIGFADKLKKGVQELFGFTSNQVWGNEKLVPDEYWSTVFQRDITPAFVLQYVGTDLFRDNFHNDFWVLTVLKEISKYPDANWVVPDVRFPNEGEAIKSIGGSVYMVDRRIELRGDIGRPVDHPSETALDGWDGWDGIIDNNGSLEDLFNQVDALV